MQPWGRRFVVGIAPSFILILVFVVVLLFPCPWLLPIIPPDHIPPNKTVDWVGLDNFQALLGGEASWSGFARVAAWTLIWAFSATVTCYFGGLIVAVLLKESNLKSHPCSG